MAAELTAKKRRLIFINIVITCIASSMLTTALSTALNAISADLDVSVSTVQWVTSGYTLVMGITMPLTAYLITRIRSRRLYIAGLIIFIAGLALSAFAPGFIVLMAGRVFQACGAGILTSMTQVTILSIFPAEKRGTAMGIYGLTITAAPVIAPTLAGILIDLSGWRMIFIVAGIIMLISLVYAVIVFDDVLPVKDIKLDAVSFVLSIFAFGGITLGIGNISSGFLSVSVLAPLIIGIAAMIVFVYRQLRIKEPLLELRTFKSKNFTLAVTGSMLLYFMIMATSVLIPLYVQRIKGYSATISGLVTLPGSLAAAVGSLIAGRIFDKMGIRKLFLTGGILILISNICMCTISMETSIWVVSGLNCVRNMGTACLLTPLLTWGVSSLSPEHTAHGNAILTSFRTIAGAIGSAVLVAVMTLVAEKSAAVYEDAAQLRGFTAAYAVMVFVAAALLCIPVFFLRKRKTNTVESESA